MRQPTRPSELPEAIVQTACPLDCPDSCSLEVTVRGGTIVEIDGGTANPVTNGFICAKVRRFGERVYGPDRLRYPAVRKGPRGSGQFARVGWDEALDLIADRMRGVVAECGGEAILPFSYGGSNGLLTQDTSDAALWRRLGTSRLARTVCAAPTTAAATAMYGKMASVSYQDYARARCILLWGVNPSASGIHMVPYVREAQRAGGRLVVVDPRVTPLAREADLHLALRPGTDVVVALAIHRFLFEHGRADLAFLQAHATGWERLRERADEWTFERAAGVAGLRAADLQQAAEWYAEAIPALVRCGWGQERNRNGGNASAAILALPAVAGKFGVRGGGYALSNSGAWGFAKPWLVDAEPATRLVNMNQLGRALTRLQSPPVKLLFVYNGNPLATMPDQQRVLAGLQRDDLFTVVFDQVMTDTAMYADVVLPATTFLEHYDIARAYGPVHLHMVRPVIEPQGEARPNADVFTELLQRLELSRDGESSGDLEELLHVLDRMPAAFGSALQQDRIPLPQGGATPVQFGDVLPRTPGHKAHLFPEPLDAEAPLGLYTFQADPATIEFPLSLISPASERTVSSTLGELARPEPKLAMNPVDAAARSIGDGDDVRVFNGLGEVWCRVHVTGSVRPGVVSLPKGLWRRTLPGQTTSNTLCPDTLTDLGGGACFNDARVEVALRAKHSASGPMRNGEMRGAE